MKEWLSKDPDEILRNTYDWSPDLAPGETLVDDVDWPFVQVVAAAGTVLEAIQQDDTTVTLIISGGTDGEEAAYLIRVHTTNDQTFEDTVALPIASKIIGVMHPGGYVDPTPENLVALYPEFGRVTRTIIEFYLTRAARYVDTSWTEGDFGYGRMLITGHLLTLAGQGTSVEATAIRDGSGEFRSMRIGPLGLERFDRSSGKVDLATTRYGREFRTLLRQNRSGARVTGSGVVTWGDGEHFGPWTQ